MVAYTFEQLVQQKHPPLNSFLYILYFKHFISLENNGLSRSIGLNKVLKTATLSNKTNKKTARTKSPQKVLHLFSTLD